MVNTIRNMDDLAAALNPIVKDMVGELAERVEKTLNHFLQEYYKSYNPTSYRRQYDFLRSAVQVKPRVTGNRVTAYVYIDTDAMDNYYSASGEQVASWANQGLHGGWAVGSRTPRVWNDTVENTIDNGELLNLAIRYLRGKGIQVQIR